ncbi:NAD(P)H-binding protein [Amycolatopsis albispora]|uniref:NmrA family transcriptional regulator n=1 Tax=Amycolatopsis albispora TaxID=1804986 RepID=A0A344L3R3_9PSEU|nr:NAD(P)H-binding protein [Amycolatopsis albispora]AXB42687.1 NmrA family transcriptional regulator [Amycolatopsis albispora]
MTANSDRKIVVTTPTGQVGSRVVRLLLQAGVRPTLLLRDAGKLDPETRARVDVEEGDQGDADYVVRATRGADALFWVNPPTSDGAAGYDRQGANAALAVKTNHIAHTVFLSSVGAEKRHGAGEIDGLARTEEHLNATGAAVTHLRCAYFFSNLLMEAESLRAGVLRTPWPLDYAMGWVDPRDIAEVAAVKLLAANWQGVEVQAVHGPEDLTFTQVARILGDVLGHEIKAEHIAADEFRSMLRSVGLPEAQVDGIAGMSAGLSSGFVPENPRSVLTTTPTTLAAWAQQHLLPG